MRWRSWQVGVGFVTGIPRVGFSHTVPEPMNTVPVQPRVRYLRVTGTVSCETRSTGDTRGFLVLLILLFIREMVIIYIVLQLLQQPLVLAK